MPTASGTKETAMHLMSTTHVSLVLWTFLAALTKALATMMLLLRFNPLVMDS